MRRFGAAIAITMLLATSGCGGSSRPSGDAISKALRQGNSVLGAASSQMSKKAADCVAKVFIESKLSDKALQAIIAANKNYSPTTGDRAAVTGLSPKLAACVSKG